MAELLKYRLVRDADNRPEGIVIRPSLQVDAYLMTANTPQNISIPTGARIAVFSATGNFYVNFQIAAVVPIANITTGEASELNPVARNVSDYTTFSMIAPNNCVVTISYYE